MSDMNEKNSRLWAFRCLMPLVFAVFPALIFGLSGCSYLGYSLGTTLPPDIRSVYVPVFVNKTGEPLVDTETTAATIREFQRDGTLRVADRDEADSILEVTLTDYELIPLRYEKDSAKTTEEYRVIITANIVFKRKRTGEILVSRRVEGETTFVPTGDLSSAKQEALTYERGSAPNVARDLAHDIVESVVEFW